MGQNVVDDGVRLEISAQRSDADGATRVQPIVPLVRWAVGEPAGVAPGDVHQKSEPVAGRRGSRGVLHTSGWAGTAQGLLSDDHLTVEGTMIESWAGQKNFQLKKDEQGNLKLPPPSFRRLPRTIAAAFLAHFNLH